MCRRKCARACVRPPTPPLAAAAFLLPDARDIIPAAAMNRSPRMLSRKTHHGTPAT